MQKEIEICNFRDILIALSFYSGLELIGRIVRLVSSYSFSLLSFWLIIPRQKPLCSIFSDPAFRANESTFPQNESGIGTEVALQPLVC